MRLQVAGKYSSLNSELVDLLATPSRTIDVPVKTLDQVLVDAQAPSPIDFLSIDVERHELEVVRGFDFERWRPRLILIEDHVLDLRLHDYLVSHGYRWIRRTGLNGWYVPKRDARPLGLYGRLAVHPQISSRRADAPAETSLAAHPAAAGVAALVHRPRPASGAMIDGRRRKR